MPFQPHLVIIYHAYNDLKAIRPNLTFKPDYSHIHTRPYGYHDKPHLIIRRLNRMMFYVRIRNNYRQYQETLALHQDLFPTAGQRDRLDTVMPEALQAFKQHIRLLTAIAHAEGARVVLSSFATLHDPSLDYTKEHNLQALSRQQKRELRLLMHFTPGLTLSAIFEGLRQYNRALREIAETEQTGWVDNATLMPHEDAYFVDRVHFSKQGAQRLAANMLPAVLEALSKD